MRIMYIEHYAGSDKYGMEFRPFYMAREWVKSGHDVTIVASDFSHLRRENPKIEKDFTEEYDSGVRFVFVKTNEYHGNSVGRVFNILGFIKKLKRHSRELAEKYKPDVVINSSTYPMDVYPAAQIAGYTGAKTFYEIHDLWPMSLLELSSKLTENNPLVKYVQKAENYCYQHCTGVISVLPDAIRHIKELGFNDVNYTYIPNGIVVDNEDNAHLGEDHKAVFDRLKSEGKFIVLYAGGHAISNALDCFVDCAENVPDNVEIVLVGKGTEKEKLTERAKSAGLNNVTFLPPVPKEQMQELLKCADCLYIGSKKSKLYSYGVGMNKIFDYMLAAKPVINGVAAPQTPLELADCGLTVPPEDAKAISEAIITLMNTPDEQLDEMGKRGREYVLENHKYNVLAEKFIDAIK